MTAEAEEATARPPEARAIPRITIQAFCDTPEIAGTIETAAMDRRMSRAHVKVHTGGLNAAAEFYRSAPTPNLIIVETRFRWRSWSPRSTAWRRPATPAPRSW